MDRCASAAASRPRALTRAAYPLAARASPEPPDVAHAMGAARCGFGSQIKLVSAPRWPPKLTAGADQTPRGALTSELVWGRKWSGPLGWPN